VAITQMSKMYIRGGSIDELDLLEKVKFNSSGTFVKANYPGAKYFVVTVQGGGGGGGGAPSGIARGSAGGGGGGCSIKTYLPSEISDSVTVTVGSGGAGGSDDNNGTGGGQSSFGSQVGSGGGGGGKFASLGWSIGGASGGVGSVSTYDFAAVGQRANSGLSVTTTNCTLAYIASRGGAGGYYFLADAEKALELSSSSSIFKTPSMSPTFVDNFNGSPAEAAAKTTNTGSGGTGQSLTCSGSEIIYGGGGDNGFVEVKVYG
jgi:hypothetical protein